MKGKIPALAKRSLAFALALALLLSLCPVLPLTAKAAHTGEWTYKDSFNWINGSFKTEDADLVYEEDQPYDWSVVIKPEKSPPPAADVVASITDANGNVVSKYSGSVSGLAQRTEGVLCTSANFAELTTDLEGTFTLTCQMLYKGALYAQLVQTFSREAAGSAPETTEGVEVETTEGVEIETTVATEPETSEPTEESFKFTDCWTYAEGWATRLEGSLVSNDSDLVFEAGQAVNWDVYLRQQLGTYDITAEVTITKDGEPIGEMVSKTTTTAKGENAKLFSVADYTHLTEDMTGEFAVHCDIRVLGKVYAQMDTTFTIKSEGGETPDEPDTPDTPDVPVVPGVTSAHAYVDALTGLGDGKHMTPSGMDFRNGANNPNWRIPTLVSGDLAAWNIVAGTAPTFTLSEEFLNGFDGNAKIIVEYVNSSEGKAELVYHSTDNTAKVHEVEFATDGTGKMEIIEVVYEVSDAAFTNLYELGRSLAINVVSGRIYLKSVKVEKPSNEPGTAYTVDLNSSVADLVFLDETPFDLTLNATTDGAIEMVDVTYTLSGGNLADALTETKKVALNKEGVAILDAAWFTEKAIGFGDFVLEVTMANEEATLVTKTFNFSRKMTSILASELKSETAKDVNGVLVFGEDDELDLKLFLKNKLSVPFTGNVTVSFYKNGALDRDQTTMVFDLMGDAKDVGMVVPPYEEYGIYQLGVSVTDEDGNEVHNKTFTFARQKNEFASSFLSSATNEALEFVDDAKYDMMLNVQKTDGFDETLNFVWGIYQGEQLLSSGKFSKLISATNATPIKPDWSGAVGYGTFTLKLQATNTLGYVQTMEMNFSRIESVKVDLTSESNPDLIFSENEALDLALSIVKQAGEDSSIAIDYTVVNGDHIVASQVVSNIPVSDTPYILNLASANWQGTGTFTITAKLMSMENGEIIKTVTLQASRIPAMTAELVYPGAQIIDGVVTYLDMTPYDFGLSMQKQAGAAEKLTVSYVVTDAEGNELVVNSVTGSVGSTEPVTAPIDLSALTGNGAFHLNVIVTDAAGIEVAATELDFARVEYITSRVGSTTNSDLVYTEGEAFDLLLGIYNSNPAGAEALIVNYEITGEGLAEPITFNNGLNATKFETKINDHTSLENLPATGTFTLTLKIGVKAGEKIVLRHQATYTFSRVALEGSVNSAVKSATSEALVFAPGGEIDMMLYIEKTDGVKEGFNAVLSITDAEGNAVLPNAEAPIKPFTSTKFKVTDLFDLTQIANPGVYTINLTLTDNAGNVRHTNSANFTLVSLEGSVELQVGSTTNPDLIYTEGEAFDLGLIMTKTDGVPEAFKAILTITDKDGNKLKEREANVPARATMKVSIQDLIDLTDLPATGSFVLNIVMIDAAGNERVNLDTPFARVKLASVKTQISSNTNKDMIFIDKDTVDLMLYVQKTDDIAEELYIQYSVFDPNGNELIFDEGKTVVPAGESYFKLPIELTAEQTAPHGRYSALLTVLDNNGNIRSETETRFVRISGSSSEIKHQVSGSSSGTKMQFTPGMKLDLCLFMQKLDGVPESLPGELYVISPSGKVVYSIQGKLNIPAGSSYFKFPLPLDGKCTEFGTYTVTYSMKDDAGNQRVSGSAKFVMISPTGEMAVAVQSTSGKFPGLIYGKDDAFDLVLYLQKADGVEQTLKLRYTISDMNGLVLETKEGNINVPALGYRKVPIELPDIEAFDKFGIFNMKVELAGPTGVLIYSENFSFSRVLTPEKQLDVLGVCTHLAKKGMTGAQAQQYVDLARQAGASFWRDELPWSTVEPAKGQYKIPAVCDTAVDYTLSIGLEPLFILDYGNSNYGSDVTTDEWLEGYLGYVEYVVTHFKGRIKYYEVWNEWNIGLGGLDKKYRDYPELYARILIPTYKLIKEIDPSITVIGGVVAGGEEEWTEGLFKCPGVMDAMDAFSFHEYSDNDIKDIIKQTETVRELLDKYGKPDMPLWLTETSWPTHIGRNSFSEEESAGNLVSLYTWAMANPGVLDQIFWYDLHNDGVERENMEHNFGLLHNWDLDKNNVPMAAKPSYVALSAMNTILIDAECVGLYDLGQKGITAYHFKKDGKDMLVAWADDKALNMIANVGDNNIIVTDMYGNASALAPVDGKVSLFFSDAPIYIEYDLTNKLEMVEGGFELDKQEYSVTPAVTFPVKITRNNGLQTYSGSYVLSLPDGWSVEGAEFAPAADGATEIIDTVYITVSDDAPKGKSTLSVRVVSGTNIMGQFTIPVEMGDICTVNPDVVFTDDGHEFKLSVEIQNAQSNKPLKGTINLLAPTALLGDASSIPFEVPAGENKAFLLDMPEDVANNFYEVKLEVVLDSGVKHEVSKPVSFLYAIKAPENMKLDGVIDEQWDGAMAFTAGEDDWLNHTGSDLEWPGNTFTGYAMWDDEYLYVAVEAYDVSHYQDGTGTSIWMGDSIQMGTDINRFYVPGELGYNDIGFSLSTDGSTIENWNWNAAPGKNVSKGGIFKVVRNDEACTTTYEVALPWSELMADGVEFKDYNQKNIGFSLLVNENSIDEEGDPTGRTGWIEYMSGIGVRKDPTKYGDLILVELPEK